LERTTRNQRRTTKDAKETKGNTRKELSHRRTQIDTDDFRALSFVSFASFGVPSSSILLPRDDFSFRVFRVFRGRSTEHTEYTESKWTSRGARNRRRRQSRGAGDFPVLNPGCPRHPRSLSRELNGKKCRAKTNLRDQDVGIDHFFAAHVFALPELWLRLTSAPVLRNLCASFERRGTKIICVHLCPSVVDFFSCVSVGRAIIAQCRLLRTLHREIDRS